MLNEKLNKGFTLIELLVVITIIGILAVGGFNIYTSQIQKARDSSRLKGLDAIKLAVEQVYQDSSEYPHTNSFGTGTINAGVGVKTYMEKIPMDAKNGQTCNGTSTCSYIYNVSADKNGIEFGEYEISIAFENSGNVESKAETDSGDDDFRYEAGIDTDDSKGTETKPTSHLAEVTEIQYGHTDNTGNECVTVADPTINATGNTAAGADTTAIYLSDDC